MTLEQLFIARSPCFASHPTGRIPNPPIFNVNGLKYTVPPYYGFNHSETQWIVNMIKSNNWTRIQRIVSCNECYLSNTYCQYPDSPDPSLGQPMFHRKAILYLTPFALAIYLRQHKLAKKMMEYVNDQQERVVNVNQPCFVTNYLERFENRNDIMVIYPFCIMFRRECFECVIPLVHNGWCPQEEIELPYRRISQVFTFHYKDIIEYCLAQMVTRPNLQLPRLLENLIEAYHNNFTLLNFENVIIKVSDQIEVEDFVSIPRRMLRYIHYYDHDMRIVSQVVSSLKIIQRYGFYTGPRRDSLAISFSPPSIGSDEQNMINDQDNSIALILAICEEADMKGHTQSREKLLQVLSRIIIDTKWFVHFLSMDCQILSNYFSNLTEKVNKIRCSTFDCARSHLASLIELMEIDVKSIRELYDPEFPKKDWKENLGSFLERNSYQSSRNNSVLKFESENEEMNDNNCGTSLAVVSVDDTQKMEKIDVDTIRKLYSRAFPEKDDKDNLGSFIKNNVYKSSRRDAKRENEKIPDHNFCIISIDQTTKFESYLCNLSSNLKCTF